MKRLILILTVLLLAGPALADDKADVQKALDQFIAARTKGDLTAVGPMLTPDFLAAIHTGRFLDKTQFLAYAKDRKMAKIDLKDPKVRVNGQLAVVTATAISAGNDAKEGKFDNKKTALTYVLIKTAQGWKLNSIHWHFY